MGCAWCSGIEQSGLTGFTQAPSLANAIMQAWSQYDLKGLSLVLGAGQTSSNARDTAESDTSGGHACLQPRPVSDRQQRSPEASPAASCRRRASSSACCTLEACRNCCARSPLDSSRRLCKHTKWVNCYALVHRSLPLAIVSTRRAQLCSQTRRPARCSTRPADSARS